MKLFQNPIVKKNRYLLLTVLAGFFALLVIRDLQTTFSLRNQIHANTVMLEEVRSRQTELETKRRNLTNPDYLEFIARGKYHVSKEGEQVFVFPGLNGDQ